MVTIEIDSDVFAYLQAHAIAFVERPNDTLRRLLKLAPPQQQEKPVHVASGRTTRKRKEPKASLLTLQRAGLLKAGQRVYLHDYRGKRLPGAEAVVAGPRLSWQGGYVSMSQLAAQLLREHGYASDSVRGPAHWFTEEGKSVKDLWAEFSRSR